MIINRSKEPIHPDDSRHLLRKAGITQKQLAQELSISESAVSLYLNHVSYSRRFWNYFYKRVPMAQMAQAS